MNIDEAIEFSRYKASQQYNELDDYEYDAEEHEQLAEWLEELKMFRQQAKNSREWIDIGYKKGVDELVGLVEDTYGYDYASDIKPLAEQLKGGV